MDFLGGQYRGIESRCRVRVFFFHRVSSLLAGILFDHDEIQERFLPVAAGMTEFEKL